MRFPYPENEECVEEWKRYFQDRERHLNSLRTLLPAHVTALYDLVGTDNYSLIAYPATGEPARQGSHSPTRCP